MKRRPKQPKLVLDTKLTTKSATEKKNKTWSQRTKAKNTLEGNYTSNRMVPEVKDRISLLQQLQKLRDKYGGEEGYDDDGSSDSNNREIIEPASDVELGEDLEDPNLSPKRHA